MPELPSDCVKGISVLPIKTLCVFGTRPEAIKMAPLVLSLAADSRFEVRTCVTGQHRQMLDQVLEAFSLQADFDLHVMRAEQDLTDITTAVMQGLRQVLHGFRPDVVLVHGDTTTALAASLAAHYQRIPVAHVEAGLRTWNLHSPWPEEANRQIVGRLAELHFAPTEGARSNLLAEGVPAQWIEVTGNTVIDALHWVSALLRSDPALNEHLAGQFPFLNERRRLILVTGHRRENFGKGSEQICAALRSIALRYPDVDLLYTLHLNPQASNPVRQLLSDVANIHLVEPQGYLPFIYVMNRAHLILTDSGGIQEEAPAMGKPVLVMREHTERPEALVQGGVRLVGTDAERICEGVADLLDDPAVYAAMSQAQSPYGDGQACRRILETLVQWARQRS